MIYCAYAHLGTSLGSSPKVATIAAIATMSALDTAAIAAAAATTARHSWSGSGHACLFFFLCVSFCFKHIYCIFHR